MQIDVFSGKAAVVLYPGQVEVVAANVVRVSFRDQPDDPIGFMVPVFTGTEAAERFIVTLGRDGEGMVVASLARLQSLHDLLVDLQQNGITHVNWNADRDKPNIPIAEVILHLANH